MFDDLRFALRQLRRSPGFAAAVILTLALAIGINTAVFSVLEGFLLRTLPWPHPERLAALITHEELKANPSVSEEDDSADDATWQSLLHNVPSVQAAIGGEAFGDSEGLNLGSTTSSAADPRGSARYVRGARVSAHY